MGETSAPGAPDGLRMIENSSVCVMAEYERCILTVWHAQATSDAFAKRHQNLIELAARYPGRCAYIEVIEPESKAPSDADRKTAVEAFKKLGKDLAAVCFVVDGPQMRAALVRTVLTGMTFLLPQMQPSKVFKRVSDAVEWIKPRMAADDPAFTSKVVAAFEYLRAAKT